MTHLKTDVNAWTLYLYRYRKKYAWFIASYCAAYIYRWHSASLLMHQIHTLYKLGVMQTTSWGLAHTATHKRLTSPQGNRLLNSMPVIGVPVGGSRMLESIINHSTLRGRFCISLYSSSNMSRNISSLCTWQITTMTLYNEESFTCVAEELRNGLYIIHKHNDILNVVFFCLFVLKIINALENDLSQSFIMITHHQICHYTSIQMTLHDQF